MTSVLLEEPQPQPQSTQITAQTPIAPSTEAQKLAMTTKFEEDFFWTYTEEPHRTRRMAIIKAHPEV